VVPKGELSWEDFAEVFRSALKAFGVDADSMCLFSGGEPCAVSFHFHAVRAVVDFGCGSSWVRATARDPCIRVQIGSDDRGRPCISMVTAVGDFDVGGTFYEFSVRGSGIELRDTYGNTVFIELVKDGEEGAGSDDS